MESPHRQNRREPPTNGGRGVRRYERRLVVERTSAAVQSFRRVATRYESKVTLSDGFVSPARAFIALSKL